MKAPLAAQRVPEVRALTALRGLAALWVVVYHLYLLRPIGGPVGKFVAIGPGAVSLFFVLSGFVLTVNYLEWFRDGFGRARTFYRRRVARLLPMHVVGLVLATGVIFAFHHTQPGLTAPFDPAVDTGGHVVSWLATLVGLQPWIGDPSLQTTWNSPAWSLGAEAVFYMAFPLLAHHVLARLDGVRGAVRLALLAFTAQLVVLAAAGYAGQHLLDPDQAREFALFGLYTSPPLRMAEFVIGCAVAVGWLDVRRRPGAVSGVLMRSGALRAALAVPLLAAVAGVAALPAPEGALLPWFELARRVPLQVPIWALLVALLAMGRVAGLERGPLLRLGRASYSLYIIHWAGFLLIQLALVSGFDLPLDAAVGGVLALLVVLSLFFHHTIEEPARWWLSGRRPVPPRLAAPRPAPAPTPAPTPAAAATARAAQPVA